MTGDRLTLTVEETAQLLGISRGSAYTAVRAGELPSIRVGRPLLVPRHALLALVGADEFQPLAQTQERPAVAPASRS